MRPKKIRQIALAYMRENALPGVEKYADIDSLGHEWGRNFVKRMEDLSTNRKPVPLSINRAMCANRNTVNKFFVELQEIMNTYKIPRGNIWNVDESGVVDVPEVNNVVGIRGEPVYLTVSGEKGERTTIVTFISSSGEAVPPMVIHSGMNVQPHWETDKPEDVLLRCSESGYINKELFCEYVDFFMDWLEAEEKHDEPHLVLMDGHKAHANNFDAISSIAEAGNHVMLIPAHCSHILQPLDKNPFSSMKHFWNYYMEKHNRNQAARKLAKNEFFSIFNLT